MRNRKPTYLVADAGIGTIPHAVQYQTGSAPAYLQEGRLFDRRVLRHHFPKIVGSDPRIDKQLADVDMAYVPVDHGFEHPRNPPGLFDSDTPFAETMNNLRPLVTCILERPAKTEETDDDGNVITPHVKKKYDHNVNGSQRFSSAEAMFIKAHQNGNHLALQTGVHPNECGLIRSRPAWSVTAWNPGRINFDLATFLNATPYQHPTYLDSRNREHVIKYPGPLDLQDLRDMLAGMPKDIRHRHVPFRVAGDFPQEEHAFRQRMIALGIESKITGPLVVEMNRKWAKVAFAIESGQLMLSGHGIRMFENGVVVNGFRMPDWDHILKVGDYLYPIPQDLLPPVSDRSGWNILWDPNVTSDANQVEMTDDAKHKQYRKQTYRLWKNGGGNLYRDLIMPMYDLKPLPVTNYNRDVLSYPSVDFAMTLSGIPSDWFPPSLMVQYPINVPGRNIIPSHRLSITPPILTIY